MTGKHEINEIFNYNGRNLWMLWNIAYPFVVHVQRAVFRHAAVHNFISFKQNFCGFKLKKNG